MRLSTMMGSNGDDRSASLHCANSRRAKRSDGQCVDALVSGQRIQRAEQHANRVLGSSGTGSAECVDWDDEYSLAGHFGWSIHRQLLCEDYHTSRRIEFVDGEFRMDGEFNSAVIFWRGDDRQYHYNSAEWKPDDHR